MTPQKHKDETLRTLVDLIEAAARQQPSIMLFEDAHWADPTTLEVLDLLIDRVKTVPLLVVLTHRPEFQSRWSGQGHVGALNLSKLTRTQSAAMVSALAGGKALPGALLEQILTRTDGVPLFVEELTKSILESGELTEGGDHYDYAGPARSVTIPATLRDSLMARLDRFMPVKEIAQIGAAIGREFSYELITAVAPMPQAQLDDALAQLIESGLAFRRGTPPDAIYTFKHALVQDAAYDSLLKSRRQELHAKIARVIEQRFPSIKATEPEVLAHHLTAAGLAEAAIPLWQTAGALALKRMALIEAIAHLNHGLELVSALPQLPNLSDHLERDRQELTLQLELGGALIAVSGYAAEKTGKAYRRARQLGEQLGDRPALIRALWGQFVHHHVRGEMDRSHRTATELLDLGERENDDTGRLAGHRAVGDGLLHLGLLADARAHLAGGIALSDGMDQRSFAFLFAENARIGCLSFLAITLSMMGFADQAVTRAAQGLHEARDLSHSTSVAFALSAACRVHCVLGNAHTVHRLADELIPFAAEQHFAFFHSTANIYRGWALLADGELAAGTELLQSGIASFKQTGAAWILPLYLGWLSVAYAKTGQVEQALGHLSTALDLTQATSVRCYEAELLRLKGQVLLARDIRSEAEAETEFGKAIVLAQQQDAKLFELRASVSLARLWMHQEKRSQAHDLLLPIYAWFTEGLATPYVQEARELISQLEQSPRT